MNASRPGSPQAHASRQCLHGRVAPHRGWLRVARAPICPRFDRVKRPGVPTASEPIVNVKVASASHQARAGAGAGTKAVSAGADRVCGRGRRRDPHHACSGQHPPRDCHRDVRRHPRLVGWVSGSRKRLTRSMEESIRSISFVGVLMPCFAFFLWKACATHSRSPSCSA